MAVGGSSSGCLRAAGCGPNPVDRYFLTWETWLPSLWPPSPQAAVAAVRVDSPGDRARLQVFSAVERTRLWVPELNRGGEPD